MPWLIRPKDRGVLFSIVKHRDVALATIQNTMGKGVTNLERKDLDQTV